MPLLGQGREAIGVLSAIVMLRLLNRIEALGTVRALEATNISSSVTERVKSLHFDDGDVVKKGDLLVRLEDAEEVA